MLGKCGRTSDCPGRRIVLHADDFGMNPLVTDGILQGFEHGLLTSTSALANAPDVGRALRQWKRLEPRRSGHDLPSSACRLRLEDPDRVFDLGVHLNLTQGRPLTGDRYPAELLDPQGRFPGIFRVFRRLWPSGRPFAAALQRELSCQIQVLLDHGHRPTHLNGHQYVETIPAVARIVPSLLERFRIPAVRVAVEPTWFRSLSWPGIGVMRWLQAGVLGALARRLRSRMAKSPVSSPDALFGTMTAGRIDLSRIDAFLACARRFNLAEIVLHPAQLPEGDATGAPDGWCDPLAQLRPKELQLLISSQLAEHLEKHRCQLGRMDG